MRLIPILILILSATPEAPLSNADVIAMVHAGISADVIIAKITTTPTAFTTTTEALVALAEAKVPEAVIKAMLARTPAAPSTATTNTAPPAAQRVIVHGVEFDLRDRGFVGDLVVDARGLTFCCASDLQVRNRYLRCTMSFQVPRESLVRAYVMGDPDHMPGVHVVDAANQGYYFF